MENRKMLHHECQTGQGSEIVRVCSAQIASVREDPGRTLAKAEGFIRHAASCGADIICFPEQFATGWDPASVNHIQDIGGSIVSDLRLLAKEHAITILGSYRRESGSRPFNTAVVIGSDGKVTASYAKIHLFSPAKENEFYSPGSELGTFSLGRLSCGIAICYDLRFPELFRIYAKRGAQAIFVPAAWPKSRIHYWDLFIRSRAAENQMYIIGVNTTGNTPVDEYAGGSMTADPYGNIISRANDSEQLLFVDLDPSIVDKARRAFPVGNDRRDTLYRELQGEYVQSP